MTNLLSLPQEDKADPMASVRAWNTRMVMMYGPRVWDQERRLWLSWEQALTRVCFGEAKTWLLDVPVWDDRSAKKAVDWEQGNWWPDWAVRAHLVDSRPCEFEDHHWKLRIEGGATELACVDPCDEPRIYCDADGRYVYPACQNVPDVEFLKYEVEVKPEWVYRGKNDWWVELNGEILK